MYLLKIIFLSSTLKKYLPWFTPMIISCFKKWWNANIINLYLWTVWIYAIWHVAMQLHILLLYVFLMLQFTACASWFYHLACCYWNICLTSLLFMSQVSLYRQYRVQCCRCCLQFAWGGYRYFSSIETHLLIVISRGQTVANFTCSLGPLFAQMCLFTQSRCYSLKINKRCLVATLQNFYYLNFACAASLIMMSMLTGSLYIETVIENIS